MMGEYSEFNGHPMFPTIFWNGILKNQLKRFLTLSLAFSWSTYFSKAFWLLYVAVPR